MNNTETLNYIALRARQFRNFLGDNQERVEYYFINFLIVSTNDLVKQKFKSGEINQIQRILESRCVYSLKETELKLKEKLKTIKNFDELTEITSYMNLARKYAVESYQDEVASFHLLGAILDNPPVFIKEFIKKENDTLTVPKEDVEEALKQFNEKPIHKIADGIGKIVAKKEEEIKNNEKITELMRKVNGMSEAITKNVKGQDHAIRAIAEGFFNAELLAESDEKRKRPRATFVFAGPPGVGKTFLAEEMAEYLELDIKRFDMSSYSDSHAAEQLIGQTAVYTNAHTGVLTDYVKANPRCILLFDEVEKAHMNVLYLFYQMLDQGVLEDLKTNEKISFKDTYIIFTTNAGHNLYEGKEDENLSLMSKKKIMNGLTKDINPITKEPFFPTALCSRLAAGTVVMFNHLQSHNLLEISQSVLEKSAKMFNDQYHIDIEFDNRIASLLMYKEGGMVDARTLRGQCDAFFKSQILNCLELFDLEKIESVLSVFNKIKFYAEDFDDIEDLDDVFKQPKHKEVLFYGNDSLGKSLSHYMEEYSWNIVSDEQEAMDIFSKKDIQVALLDVMSKEEAKRQKNKGGTIYAFDNVSVSSQSFDKARSFVEQTTKRFPEVPIYLIDKGLFKIDEQLKMKLIQLGVRGIVDSKDYKVTTYKKIIDECLDHSHIQLIANHLKSKHLMMKYEISYKLLKEEKELHVRTRKYTLGEYIDPEDEEHLVSDAQRPTIKFDDVIGAEDAKEELKFFIDYLKNLIKHVLKE